MYKVILVDDEDIEREGMAAIIPWESLGLTLVDMAWNGFEGLEKIKEKEPDIVITDIKMPVMDGIQLIRRVREEYPHIMFIVLSGYGEYEYTSRAMELGIRHYILKPCDEIRIAEVLSKVKQELAGRQEQKKTEQEYRNVYRLMLPHVKERILENLIEQEKLAKTDEVLLEKFLENVPKSFLIVTTRSQKNFDQLDGFVLINILEELAGNQNVYLSAARGNEIICLFPATERERLPGLLKKAHMEYRKYKKTILCSAISRDGGINGTALLYGQTQELLRLNDIPQQQEILTYDMRPDADGSSWMIVDYTQIRSAQAYDTLLFEIYAAYVKMGLRGFSGEQMYKVFQAALEFLFGKNCGIRCEMHLTEADPWLLLENVVESCAGHMHLAFSKGKEEERMRQLLYAVYKNIKNPELSAQYLAREVPYVNEDYFGRLFSRYTNEKYSAYLLRIRISLAERLIVFNPELKVAELAEQTGYPVDGQYFSKVFKKRTGMTPSEYRRTIMEKSDFYSNGI